YGRPAVSFGVEPIDEVYLPVPVVPVWKILAEMPSAALLASQGGAGDQPRHGDQVQVTPRVAVGRPRVDAPAPESVDRVETRDGFLQSRAGPEQARASPHQVSNGRRIERLGAGGRGH